MRLPDQAGEQSMSEQITVVAPVLTVQKVYPFLLFLLNLVLSQEVVRFVRDLQAHIAFLPCREQLPIRGFSPPDGVEVRRQHPLIQLQEPIAGRSM